jgi:hypothetical protein
VTIDVQLEQPVHMGTLAVVAGRSNRIALDGKLLGEGQWEGKVQSGGHTLRVTAPGMTPYQSEVVIQDDQLRRIQVSLTPLVKPSVPAWVWITGGVALAAGAVVGGVVLARPDPAPPIRGTLTDPVPTSIGGRF